MKQFLAIPLIFIMLVKPLWPVAEYIINYDYIATNLCENKNRPQLQCDGKCYLAKMFAKKSKNDRKNPFAEGQLLEIPLILEHDYDSDLNAIAWALVLSKDSMNTTERLHSLLFVFEIIHPPEVASS